MAKDRDIYDEELSEADRLLHKLYEETKEPVEWDASDDAVMALSRQISLPGAGSAADQEPDLGANVVRMRPRSLTRRIVQTPGFAIAASVVVGLFVGQGLTPYVDLGVAPDYTALLSENDRLQGAVEKVGSEVTILRTRNIEILDQAESEAAGPRDDPTGPGLVGLASVLGQFECAALSATLEKNGRVAVNGHVSSDADLERLSQDLAGFGFGPEANQAAIFAWPHCEAVEILQGFTASGRDPGGAPTIRPFNHGQRYSQGENMVIEATAPTDMAAFVYVDFVQQDGTVVHLSPTDGKAANRLDAGTQLILGQGAQRYRVEPPFGTEMVMVVSSPVPLFDGPRPQVEPAMVYLGALRAALSQARDAGNGAALRSDFSFLVTAPDP